MYYAHKRYACFHLIHTARFNYIFWNNQGSGLLQIQHPNKGTSQKNVLHIWNKIDYPPCRQCAYKKITTPRLHRPDGSIRERMLHRTHNIKSKGKQKNKRLPERTFEKTFQFGLIPFENILMLNAQFTMPYTPWRMKKVFMTQNTLLTILETCRVQNV